MYKQLLAPIAILSFIILITGCTAPESPSEAPTPISSLTLTPSSPTPTFIPTPSPSSSPKPNTPPSTNGIIKGTYLYNPFDTHNYEYVATITDYLGTRPYKWADSNLTTDTYNGRSAYHWKVNEYDTSHSLAKTTDYYYDKDHVLLGGHIKIQPNVDGTSRPQKRAYTAKSPSQETTITAPKATNQ